ncbi:hypothetical protein DXT99_05510 [Pontibacter diazotrophicus]|uniref:Uncharacterized protein n=1 Tax=Pontibacter diazotrophicus TaxID=1400979 RepID=A0A3D8LFF5_9BACT|nr:hypothetical protein [Pontibacter diazotrophicus]RDV16128.1 hypothetical protein DXT99_05510 [Pontibacter diazotrophicus]
MVNIRYLKGVAKYARKRLSYYFADLANIFFYDTVKEPYRLIKVNPAAISMRLLPSKRTDKDIFANIKKEALHLYDLERGAFDPKRNTGRILGGDWDLKKKPYDVDMMFESYNKRFNEGANWEDTAVFEQGVGVLEKGGIMYGCRTLEEFKSKRLDYIDNLCHDIRTNGFRTQNNTLENDKRSQDTYHEITVNIGRNGELIYNNCTGNNRLALAKALQLEYIPVLVVVRHKKWELLKKKVRENHTSGINSLLVEQVRSHPDFQAE